MNRDGIEIREPEVQNYGTRRKVNPTIIPRLKTCEYCGHVASYLWNTSEGFINKCKKCNRWI